MAGVLFLLWERSVQSAVPPHLLRAREIIEGLAPSHLPVPLLPARGIDSREVTVVFLEEQPFAVILTQRGSLAQPNAALTRVSIRVYSC